MCATGGVFMGSKVHLQTPDSSYPTSFLCNVELSLTPSFDSPTPNIVIPACRVHFGGCWHSTCSHWHPMLALFDISIWHIDCRYIDTFEKYRYRYRYGEVENIDIDIDIDRAILKNIDIDIDIDKAIPKISISISISIWWFWKISISISISIRQFCKISISIKYRIDSNLAYRTGLGLVRSCMEGLL